LIPCLDNVGLALLAREVVVHDVDQEFCGQVLKRVAVSLVQQYHLIFLGLGGILGSRLWKPWHESR